MEEKKGVFYLVTLFLILTVGWFIYAFIRFTQELVLGLREVSPPAGCPGGGKMAPNTPPAPPPSPKEKGNYNDQIKQKND